MIRSRTDRATVEETYQDFWKDLVEAPGGTLDPDKVKAELHDYQFMLEQVPQVYDHISGGRISKPNTYGFEVIGEADAAYARWAAEDAAGELEAALDMTPEQIRNRIEELKRQADQR